MLVDMQICFLRSNLHGLHVKKIDNVCLLACLIVCLFSCLFACLLLRSFVCSFVRSFVWLILHRFQRLGRITAVSLKFSRFSAKLSWSKNKPVTKSHSSCQLMKTALFESEVHLYIATGLSAIWPSHHTRYRPGQEPCDAA